MKFKEGQVIAYIKGNNVEIGKIKRLTDGGAFVWYHSGETAANTRLEDMQPITNAYCITGNILGGEDQHED